MIHYRFKAEFCNPRAENEKGNVENKVGYTRRNYFVPVPVIEDMEEYNKELLKRCDRDAERTHYKKGSKISELWEEEKERLLYLPEHGYDVCRYEAVRLNKYGCAVIDTNRYGLSPSLAGETVQTKIYYDRIELYYEHRLLKSYERSYGRHAEILDWTQYVGTLCKKPGAAEHTRFFHQMPALWQEHLKRVKGAERKSALMLLREIVEEGNASLCDETLAFALECGRTDADSIKQCYYMLTRREKHPAPLKELNAPAFMYDPSLYVYDDLTGGGKHA